VCEVNSENLREFFSALGQRAMYGICTGKKSVTAFVSSENLKETINCIHKLGSVIGVSAKSGVGAIEVNHPDFIDSPGCLAKICDVLSLKNINIIEVTTSKATISVFVDEKKLQEASEALGEVI
jgi:aspartokinase